MIVTYLRSSSYGTWDFCPHKYFLDYTLGYHSPANKSAEKGSITHKALELLARKKLAMQNGQKTFSDEELDAEFDVMSFDPTLAIDLSYDFYTSKKHKWLNSEIIYEWKPADYRDCKKWMETALTYRNGMFSPLKREIVMPEQYFDIEIKEPWAKYEYYLPSGEAISGYLGIKGTMDLMTKVGNNYEMIDWKTGARRNWITNTEKKYDDLMKDPQLLLYYYATKLIYPKIKNIFVTIFYLQSGGPFSMCFGEEELELLKNLLKRRLNAIRNTVRPKLIYPNRRCSWCHFSKNTFDGPTDNYNESICQTVKQELVQLGMDKVMDKRGRDGGYNSYGSGGGRTRD